MKPTQLFALALFACAAACGGDDDGGGDGADPVDAGAAIDAQGDPDATPVSVACGHIETLYGDLGAVTGDAVLLLQDEKLPNGEKYLSLGIALNQESPPDVLFLELWEGFEPYEAGIEAGAVGIIEAQSDVFQCGACTYIAGDFVPGENVNFYMARSGTVTIDEVDPTVGTGVLRGSLDDITVREIRIVPGVGQEVVEDGCVANIASVSFDVGVVAPSMAAPSASVRYRSRADALTRAP